MEKALEVDEGLQSSIRGRYRRTDAKWFGE